MIQNNFLLNIICAFHDWKLRDQKQKGELRDRKDTERCMDNKDIHFPAMKCYMFILKREKIQENVFMSESVPVVCTVVYSIVLCQYCFPTYSSLAFCPHSLSVFFFKSKMRSNFLQIVCPLFTIDEPYLPMVWMHNVLGWA